MLKNFKLSPLICAGVAVAIIGEVKINFTSQIVRGVKNTGMPTLGYFALLHIMRGLDED